MSEKPGMQVQNGNRGNAAERIMPMTFSGAEKSLNRSIKPAMLAKEGQPLPLEFLFDVPVTLVFEVGRIEINIKQLLELNKGSYLELRNVSVDIIDIRINDKIMAYGENLALQQRYGIRFNELEQFTCVEDLENGQ